MVLKFSVLTGYGGVSLVKVRIVGRPHFEAFKGRQFILEPVHCLSTHL